MEPLIIDLFIELDNSRSRLKCPKTKGSFEDLQTTGTKTKVLTTIFPVYSNSVGCKTV